MALHNQNQIDGRSSKDEVEALKESLRHAEEKNTRLQENNVRLQENVTELQNSLYFQQQPSPFESDASVMQEQQPYAPRSLYMPQPAPVPQYGLSGGNFGRPSQLSGGWNLFHPFQSADVNEIISTGVWEVDNATNFNELHKLIGRALNGDPVDVGTIESDEVRQGYMSISSLVSAAPQAVVGDFGIIQVYIDRKMGGTFLSLGPTCVDTNVLAELIEAYRLACAPEREWRLCVRIRPVNAMDCNKRYLVYRFGPNLRTKTPCSEVEALRGVTLMKF